MSVEEKKEEKRRKILESATKLFLKSRIHNVSIKDISKDAGVALGTVYVYYKNKDELLLEVFKRFSEEQTKKALKNIDDSLSLKEKILLLFSYYINDDEKEFINLYSDYYMICMSSYNQDQQISITRDYGELFNIIESAIKHSIDTQEIKYKDAYKLADSFCAVIDGLFFYSVIIKDYNFISKLNKYLDIQIELLS